MSGRRHSRTTAGDHRSPRWPVRGAIVAVAVAVAFLALPPLAGVPARLVEGCARWIALAGILELLSVLGFIVVFKLVFGPGLTWSQSSPAGLRALAASTVLPAGGLIGPAAGAWSGGGESASLSRLTRSSVVFLVVTSAPGMIALSALGLMLWLGWLSGPHRAALTLVPAGLAFAVLAVAWHSHRPKAGKSSGCWSEARGRSMSLGLARPVGVLRDALADAHALVLAGNWKLFGAVGYYAFDNAVLWAAFRAYGPAPPLSVVVMGYLIGSLGAVLPTPAGIGGVEGGLIGALVLYGTPAAPAAAAVLLYRGISLALPILLGVLAWARVPAARLGGQRPSRPRRHGNGALARSPADA